MNRNRHSLLAGACVAMLLAGCATSSGVVELDARNTRVAGVYRVQEPVGTAAGQYAVGRMDLAAGRVAAAIERFENALRLDPNFVEAHNGLGVAYGHLGRYAEAAQAFRSALASGPAAAHLLNNLGFAQLRAGQLPEASASLARAIALDPSHQRTRENIRLLEQAQAQAAAAQALRNSASQAGVAMAASGQASSADEAGARVEPVRAPALQAAKPPMPTDQTDWSVRLTSAAQAMATTASQESARNPSYEVVLAKSSDSQLVQLAPNLYELRPRTPAPSAAAVLPKAELRRERSPESRPGPRPEPTSLAAIDRLEVSNGVGVRHLAGRTARQLSRFGAGVTRVSDYRRFGKQRTEIHYRDGHLAGAKALQQRLPVDVKLVRAGQLHAGVNIRLVVGRDLVAGQVASWLDAPDLASAAVAGIPRHL